MSKNKESYFSAEKVDSSYIKKNGKRNVSPLKKIISFALTLSLISSSGVAISKLYKEKHNEFDISSITFGTLDNTLNDNIYFSYNSNDFLYMMPDCSSNKKTNIICEKLNEKEIDAAKK